MSIQTQTPGSAGLPVNAPLGGLESGVNANGGVQVLKITGLSSDVPASTGPVNICTAYNGDIEILNILVQTDSIGLAGSGNFRIGANSPYGGAYSFIETVANLGASAARDLYTASVTKQRLVVQQGSNLQVSASSTALTGPGKWVAYIEYRPLVPAAMLA